VQHLTGPKTKNNLEKHKMCEIYKLTCNIFKLLYIGQTNINLKHRYQEYIRYIKQNDPRSAYALRILKNNHEYGRIITTMTFP